MSKDRALYSKFDWEFCIGWDKYDVIIGRVTCFTNLNNWNSINKA